MIDLTLAASPIESAFAQNFIPAIAITGGLIVGAIAILGGIFHSVSATKSRETTRRELAAYVAEGTISPDDAVRMLTAGLSPQEQKAARSAFGCCAPATTEPIPART